MTDRASESNVSLFTEADRLKVLGQYPLQDADERRLDRIARLAAQICGTPIALVSIVEEDEQVFIGKAGLTVCSTDRQSSFCAHAMRGEQAMVVPDAARDPRFASNPLVTGEPNIRFYAGQPLVSPEGMPLGALCVIDDKPRDGLSEDQAEGLATLAVAVMALLETARTDARSRVEQDISQSEQAELQQRFEVLADSLPQMVWSTPPDGMSDYFNKQWCDFTGLPAEASFGTGWLGFLHPEDAPIAAQAWTQAVATGSAYEVRYRMRRHDGQHRWVIARGLPLTQADGTVTRWIGTCTDIDDEVNTADALELLSQELHHRIKNIFAVVGGLVSLSSRSHPDAAEFATDLYNRILALGRAHAFIGSPGSRSDGTVHGGLKGMLSELLLPYRTEKGDQIRITGDEIAMDDRSATPLALVFHELATNSAKYGAIGSASGTVEIALSDGDPVQMRWIERGTTRRGEKKPGGFGSRLIDMSIRRQLGGDYDTVWGSDSLEITMSVPQDNIERK
ncbi:MAG: PAS domain-containing protein [Novosphingobium sp.]